jgi:hypothetical protein
MRSSSRNQRAFRWLVVALLWQAPAAFAQPPVDEGRRLFEAGADAYAKGQYELAVAAFNEAYRRTQRPGLLFSLAQAHRGAYERGGAAEHLRAAIEYYTKYLEQTPNGPRVDKARGYLEQLQLLQAKVSATSAPAPEPLAPPVVAAPGMLEVAGNAGAQLFVDGSSRGTLPIKPLAAAAGEHVVEVRQAGHVTLRQTVTVAANRTLQVGLEARQTTQRTTGLTMLGLGGGALLAGGALGYVALRQDSEAVRLDREEPDNIDAYNAAVSSRNGFRLAAALSAGAGLALGVGGVLALVLERGDSSGSPAVPANDQEPQPRSAARMWAPDYSFDRSGFRIGAHGSF